MGTLYKIWDLVGPGHIKMFNITLEQMCSRINSYNTEIGIGIDGSSSNTGIAIMTKDMALVGTTGFKRAKKGSKDEDYVEYKIRLKEELRSMLLACKNCIKYVWYEEPFVGYADSSSVLMAIRTTVKEILIENKEELSGIVFREINNKKWKKIFLETHNSRLPGVKGNYKTLSDAEKAAIASVLTPRLLDDNLESQKSSATQDEMDAIGIAFTGWHSVKFNINLASKKAVHSFSYEIRFELYNETPEDTEQGLYSSIYSSIEEYNIPTRVTDNGITIKILNGRGQFENLIYENMGEDDKLLVFVYKACKYANILFNKGQDSGILNAINDLGDNQTIVAYIWRKNRRY